MKTKKFGGSTKVYFRNMLPKTDENKSLAYYKFGHNDNLPLEIIEMVNNSGAAKKAAKKYASYIEADGFSNEATGKFQVNKTETADKILSKIAVSYSYMGCCVLHISRLGNGRVGEIKLMPFQKIRKATDGSFTYNPTIGTAKLDKSKLVHLQAFQGEVATIEAMQENKEKYGGRGEILYFYDGNPFDSDIYAVPDFMAGIEDVITSSEIQKMDLEAVYNGFVLGGIFSFIGVDDTEEGEDGLTDRARVDDAMMQFTGQRKNANGLSSRFAAMTHFAATKDDVPVYTANDPKPILEASNSKRDIIERAVCRLWGVHPALVGYSEAAILGNDKAIAQAENDLRATVNPVQRQITQMFESIYGNGLDWTISEVKSNYIDPALYPDMQKDERRNLISLPPEQTHIPTAGDVLLTKLNSLSPLLATKVIDLIDKETLLDALGIKSKIISPENPLPNEQ